MSLEPQLLRCDAGHPHHHCDRPSLKLTAQPMQVRDGRSGWLFAAYPLPSGAGFQRGFTYEGVELDDPLIRLFNRQNFEMRHATDAAARRLVRTVSKHRQKHLSRLPQGMLTKMIFASWPGRSSGYLQQFTLSYDWPVTQFSPLLNGDETVSWRAENCETGRNWRTGQGIG